METAINLQSPPFSSLSDAQAASTSAVTAPPKRLAIFGATRGVGRALVEAALAQGNSITALCRDPGRLDIEHPKLKKLCGDVTDPNAVQKTLADADAALITLGAGVFNSQRVRQRGTRTVLEGMRAMRTKRLVCLTMIGTLESRKALPAVLRYLLVPIYLRQPLLDHEAQERLIRQSGVEWTVVRPPHLTDGPATGKLTHGFDDMKGRSTKVSRADVASFMLAQLGNTQYSRQSVSVAYPT